MQQHQASLTVCAQGLLAWLALAVLTGCTKPTATPAVAPPSAGDRPTAASAEELADAKQAKLFPGPLVDAALVARLAADDLLDDSLAASLPQTIQPTKRRLLVLLPTRPLVIDLEMIDAGQPIATQWATAARTVGQAADSNDDDQTTWSEFLEFSREQLGGQMASQSDLQKMVTDAYDLNNNSLVEADELVRYFNRSNGGQGFLTIARRQAAPSESQDLFPWLDRNSDQTLDATELANCGRRLSARDADGDGKIAESDFRETLTVLQTSMNRSRPRGRKETELFVVPSTGENQDEQRRETSWQEILYGLEKSYSFGDELSVDDLPAEFKQLDTNDDAFIGRDELRGVNLLPAEVTVQIDFAGRDQSNTLHTETSLDSSLRSRRFRSHLWQLADETITLQIFLDDELAPSRRNLPPPSNGPLDAVARLRLFALLSDNRGSLFSILDQDDSKWLDQKELAASQALIIERDKNGDGRVEMRELVDGKRLTLRRARSDFGVPPQRPQPITPRSEGPNWFIQMDSNRDGYVQEIEFLGTSQQFQSMDADHDGRIGLAEIP